MPKTFVLNEGSQRDFVTNDSRYSAYIGGLGSGKTFAGIARGLRFAQQTKPKGALYGARGLVGAINYPVLNRVVLPQFWEMVEGTDLVADWRASEKKATLKNGAEIIFASLDDADKIRGIEISWFFIDEGRHLTRAAWDVLVGRLRQRGFDHGGWVCSTPNGYDWMYQLFHDESPDRLDSCKWYGASTYANKKHLPAEYIKDLERSYEGKFFDQEVLGEFVGLMQGAVFPEFDVTDHVVPLAYDANLPLYSWWDFGIGDAGVCLWVQLAWREKELPGGEVEFVPEVRLLDFLEAKDWNATEWAAAWHEWRRLNVMGRMPTSSWGDPAGKQRSMSDGKSVIDALRVRGVPVNPAPKKPKHDGIMLLRNLMAGGRVLVNDTPKCRRLAQALATNKWPTDENGNKVGSQPVHDWTSHFCDAAQFGATALLTHNPKRAQRPKEQVPYGSMAHIVQQILKPNPDTWLGPQEPKTIEWAPRELHGEAV